MTPTPVRIRRLLLVALSAASFPGEKLAALDHLRRTLLATGHDEHWLADRLQFEDSPFAELAQRRFERMWREGWPT